MNILIWSLQHHKKIWGSLHFHYIRIWTTFEIDLIVCLKNIKESWIKGSNQWWKAFKIKNKIKIIFFEATWLVLNVFFFFNAKLICFLNWFMILLIELIGPIWFSKHCNLDFVSSILFQRHRQTNFGKQRTKHDVAKHRH